MAQSDQQLSTTRRAKPARRSRKKRRGTKEILLAVGLFAASAACLAAAFVQGYDGRPYVDVLRNDLDAAGRLHFAGYLTAGLLGLLVTFRYGRQAWIRHRRRGGRTAAMLAIIAAMAVLVRMFSSV